MSDTEELKMIIAGNISELRKQHGLTQIELAEKLNYSDKAVSKWERGESVPDISGLKIIADHFGVTVDYLITADHTSEREAELKISKRRKRNRGLITGISVMLVWLLTVLVYMNMDLARVPFGWLTFILAVPVSCVVWLVFNSLWFNKKVNFLIISLLMWSAVASVYVSLLVFGINVWLIFCLCVPGQAIILMWSGIKTKLHK